MELLPITREELSSSCCMQSSYWARLKGAHGWSDHAFSLDGTTLLVLSRTFFRFFTLAYVPFGPGCDVSLSVLSRQLTQFLPKTTFAIRYDLPYGNKSDDAGCRTPRQSVQPDATVKIRLSGDYPAISSLYHQRAIRALKRSQSLIDVRLWSGDQDSFDMWYAVYHDTALRDGFSARSKTYLHDVLAIQEGEVSSKLFLAFREGRIVGGTILLSGKDESVYLFGASERMKDCTVGYILQDAMIRYCIDHECPWYDFYGISGEKGRGAHLRSLDLFKTAFGGEKQYRRPTCDFPIKKLGYRLFAIAETLRYRRQRAV